MPPSTIALNNATTKAAPSERKKFIEPVAMPICDARHRILHRDGGDRKHRADAEPDHHQDQHGDIERQTDRPDRQRAEARNADHEAGHRHALVVLDHHHQPPGQGRGHHRRAHQRDQRQSRLAGRHVDHGLEIERHEDRQSHQRRHAAGAGKRGAAHDRIGEHGQRQERLRRRSSAAPRTAPTATPSPRTATRIGQLSHSNRTPPQVSASSSEIAAAIIRKAPGQSSECTRALRRHPLAAHCWSWRARPGRAAR